MTGMALLSLLSFLVTASMYVGAGCCAHVMHHYALLRIQTAS